METRELRYFVALAEELHFARAAARVGIAQPPLSKAISELERRLGVRLFVRTTRSTTLTSVGEMLLHDARRILADIERAHRSLLATANGHSGRLRIALCDGLAQPRTAQLLWRARDNDPNVDIRITHATFPEILRELRSGTVDVGFAPSASPDQDLRSILLWQDSLVLVSRLEGCYLSKQNGLPFDFKEASIALLGSESTAAPHAIGAWLRSMVQSDTQIEYVPSVEMLLTWVVAGYGVGIMSDAQAKAVHRPDLLIRPLTVTDVKMPNFLIHRRENASTLVAAFAERALQALQESGSM